MTEMIKTDHITQKSIDQSRIEELEKALRFYADHEIYRTFTPDSHTKAELDYGATARKALERK